MKKKPSHLHIHSHRYRDSVAESRPRCALRNICQKKSCGSMTAMNSQWITCDFLTRHSLAVTANHTHRCLEIDEKTWRHNGYWIIRKTRTGSAIQTVSLEFFFLFFIQRGWLYSLALRKFFERESAKNTSTDMFRAYMVTGCWQAGYEVSGHSVEGGDSDPDDLSRSIFHLSSLSLLQSS